MGEILLLSVSVQRGDPKTMTPGPRTPPLDLVRGPCPRTPLTDY